MNENQYRDNKLATDFFRPANYVCRDPATCQLAANVLCEGNLRGHSTEPLRKNLRDAELGIERRQFSLRVAVPEAQQSE